MTPGPCHHSPEERQKAAGYICPVCLADEILSLQQEVEEARKLGHELSHMLRELREENERLKSRLATI